MNEKKDKKAEEKSIWTIKKGTIVAVSHFFLEVLI